MIAATEIGFVRMRVSKVVGLNDGDHFCEFVVLSELDGARHLVIQIGRGEAFALAASLGDVEWGRPMTYQFMAELVRSLGGRIREIRLDALVSGAYAATVEAEGPHGVELVDARSSDALNLAVLMRRALTTPPMTVRKAER